LPASFVPSFILDADSDRPMYRQIYDWFQQAIVGGQLRPGQSVPSSRRLATELKISRIPVFNAYEQLCAEGYLETFVGAGTRVARSIPDDDLRPAHGKELQAPRRSVVSTGPRRKSRRAAVLMKTAPQPWLDHYGAFRVSLPALDHFPSGTWSKLLTRHSRVLHRDTMGYGNSMGFMPFREAIALYLSTVRGVRCQASQILVTSGSQQALQICAHVLLDQEDSVALEDPGYPGARQAFLASGARLVGVPVDDEGMQVGKLMRLRDSVRAVYITPSHQYPLGVAMSAARRMQLLNWAARTSTWVIEDDYDSEYRFGNRPIVSLQGLDTRARVVYIGTFSKVLFPAIRLGYVVVPHDLVPAFAACRDAADIFPSTLYQAVATDFIREGHFARHIRRMKMLYMERRNCLTQTLHAELGRTLQIIGSEAGMHLTALLPRGVDDSAIASQAAEQGISAMPLSSCYLHRARKSGLILGYGATSERQIKQAIRTLARVMER
jgi:GntR family transcriptional regulator / MocR family aminotransferase